MSAVRHALEHGAVLTAAGVARIIGRRRARGLGRFLGLAWYRFGAKHRRVAAENLQQCLPDLPAQDRAAIARASFRHFGELILDLLVFSDYTRAEAESLAVVEGWEHLERAHARGQGVFVFSAHFSHWELVALLQGFRGLAMDLVVRPMNNPHVERYLARLRRRSGNRVLHKRRAVRGILEALRDGRTVGMVIDQNYRGTNPFFVDFFGRPAATTPTLGMLAARTGAPVVPVFCWPRPDGGYRIVYSPEVRLETSGDRGADAYRLTAHCTKLIEEQIRSRPELWSWMHRRWRTRPMEPMPLQAPVRPARRYRRRAQG